MSTIPFGADGKVIVTPQSEEHSSTIRSMPAYWGGTVTDGEHRLADFHGALRTEPETAENAACDHVLVQVMEFSQLVRTWRQVTEPARNAG
ncbi:hypothetical protein [Streptomyces fuscichromogenes]|uniref:Uncharacterized protein n=1 Tax=Streptomyces fuscichromogenes TaxID=1324013 RepID=A0A917XC32_9ACTN|nr:hypothetical protein [Streptomyces fuscichromogenes]GGN07182.1 hypothetical protein GCM10011578_031660 [Streptomyces fuscichromogenes]